MTKKSYEGILREGRKVKEELERKLACFENIKKEMSINELQDILGTTVKHDNINKLITFFAMLTAYTEESQFNVSFRAPSTTGKSYLPIEVSSYFPKEDILMIAYSSPTSFYHDTGVWDEEKQAIIINFERKILIFLDQPHDLLLQRLRPLLSHDQKELLYKITDKREKKGLRTKNVIIKGFPSVIFCTGSLKIDEQEATRNFILSPETTSEKIREGIFLKALRKGNPIAFQEFLAQHPEREMLRERVKLIKEAKIKHIIIENIEEVVERFITSYPKLKPRHQRDIERIISLIQGLALFNFWHRRKDENGNIYANQEDVETAFSLFKEIAESQELGIPPFLYKLFKEIIEPLWKEKNKNNSNPIGLTRKEVLAKHFEVYGTVMPEWYLKQEILPPLESCGLIYQEQDPSDKRRTLIFVPSPPSHSTYFEKVESEGGVKKYVEYKSGVGDNSFELADKSDMSDDLYTCGKESNIEETEENAIKTSNFEGVENSLHANNLSDLSDMSAEIKRTFLRLPEGYYGKCSYCGENTFLEWIDSKGNHLCNECRWGEE